jgi:hypothetical protein
MYSPRQRDVRERRHQQTDDFRAAAETATDDHEESVEFESPSGWGIQMNARPSAA